MRDINELAQDVLKHADIVQIISSYIPTTKKGKNYVAVCPFHDDTNPSLSISPERQFFKCFVCGTGGTAISFVQKYEHISYIEAIKKVAELSNYHPDGLDNFARSKPVDEKKTQLIKCLYDLNLYYQFALNTPEGKEGLDYLESRHLDLNLRNKYKLGYAYKDGKATIAFLQKKGHSIKTIEDTGIAKMLSPGTFADMNEGRVTFPICDQDGNVIGFSARKLVKGDDSPKYMNSPETYLFHKTNVLYNYHIAKDAAKLKGYIYICEGFMDVFALARIGIDAAVAIMGTSLTAEHIALLRTLNVELRLCLDGDLPGQSAMMKISNMLTKAGLNFRVVDNQGSSKDPDEILNEDGEDALRAYLEKLVSRLDFALNYYLRSNPLKTVDEKKRLIKEFIPILAKINSQIELDSYLRRLEKITGFDQDSIRKLVSSYRLNENEEGAVHKTMKGFHPERIALQKLVTAERELLFQMMGNEEAVAFYEDKVGTFYDDVYRIIANYIIAYKEQYGNVDITGIMLSIENSEEEKKEEIMSDVLDIMDEDFHPKECNQELLDNLLDTIEEEKDRISEEDALNDSLEGKSELEQARIIAEFNRRKANRKK